MSKLRKLHLAVIMGDASQVSELIATGINVNAVTEDGATALMLAKGQPEIVRLLLSAGADVSVRDTKYGGTALHSVAFRRRDLLEATGARPVGSRKEAAKLLIEAGAEVNARNAMGFTPLHNAAYCGLEEVAALLLESDADPLSINVAGLTPVELAQREGHTSVVKTIVSAAKDPDIKLQTALLSREVDVARIAIAELADINARYSLGRTPLLIAVQNGLNELIEELVKQGAEVDLPDSEGITPLLWSLAMCNEDGARKLLEAGAEPKRRTEDGTVLRKAKSPGGLTNDVGPALQSRGMLEGNAVYEIAHRWATERSHLSQAVAFGSSALIGALLEKGADPNAQDTDGASPLHAAISRARRGSEERASNGDGKVLVHLLLAAGADPNATASQQPRALADAVDGALEDIAASLLECGADPNTVARGEPVLVTAVRRGLGKTSDLLIRNGADVSATDRRGRTALHIACLSANVHNAQRLLNAGADPSAKDTDGVPVLHGAVIGESEEVVDALIRSGADVSATDRTRRTALHIACSSGNRGVAIRLLNAGADPSTKNAEGKTPRRIARDNAHKNLATLVRKHERPWWKRLTANLQ